MKRHTVLALTIAVGLAWPAPLVAADVDGFDILGIQLGMSPDEVEAQARAKGFDDVVSGTGPSFEQLVAIESREQVLPQDFSGILSMKFGSDREAAEVYFVQTPAGSQVSRVTYRFFGTGVNLDQMTDQVLEKYGQPDLERASEWLWGDTAEYALQRKGPFLEFDRDPMRVFGPQPLGYLTLADPSLRAEVNDAVAEAASQRTGGEQPRF